MIRIWFSCGICIRYGLVPVDALLSANFQYPDMISNQTLLILQKPNKSFRRTYTTKRVVVDHTASATLKLKFHCQMAQLKMFENVLRVENEFINNFTRRYPHRIYVRVLSCPQNHHNFSLRCHPCHSSIYKFRIIKFCRTFSTFQTRWFHYAFSHSSERKVDEYLACILASI